MDRLASLQIAFRLVPAYVAALEEHDKALVPSKKGGRQIVGEKAELVADQVLRQLRPSLLEILSE